MNDDPPPQPPTPRKTGPAPLPRQKTGQYPVSRKTTGHNTLPRHPSGANPIRPPTGSYSTGHAHPQRKSDFTLLYILGGVMVVTCIMYFAFRDTWEQDNKRFILQLRHEAETLRPTQKRSALEKYDTLVKMIGSHTLKDPEVKSAYDDARKQVVNVSLEMELENNKNTSPDKGGSAKPRAGYARYESLSQPLLDGLQRCKANADSGVALQKQRDDVADVIDKYGKWYDALTDADTANPSFRLIRTAKESYSSALDWWTIEIDKKMPNALFADMMKRNEWSQAAYALNKVKTCMDAKDIVERRACSPCNGTGKMKCPICLGDGICKFCKGKGDPVLNCCDNGVCFACKGRKESDCKICNGTTEFPPSPPKQP